MTTNPTPAPDAPISVALIAERNDEELEKSVSAWDAHLDKSGRDYEIVVVGCGTTVTPKFSRFPRVQVAPQEPGLGAAIRSALSRTRHPLFFYTMGDLRYRAADLARLLPHVDRRGMVLGFRWEYDETWIEWLLRVPSRMLGRRRSDPECYRESWAEWRLKWIAQQVFGVRFRDPSCVYLLARREIFQHISIQSDGFFGHVEIMAKGTFTNVEMEEVSISYRPRKQPTNVPPPRWLRDGWRIFQHPDFRAS